RALRGEQLLKPQVSAVGRVRGEVGDVAGIFLRHALTIIHVMLKLCGFHISNYHNKVRLALLEKGIEFEEDATCTPKQTEAYLARSPMGKAPFLEFGDGRRLSESEVICEYLEDSYPQ